MRESSASRFWNGTGRPVRVDEDAPGRAPRGNQRERTRRDAVSEEPLSFAEHHRSDPEAMFVDDAYTMIAAPVQGDVDGVPKGSHFARVPPMGYTGDVSLE